MRIKVQNTCRLQCRLRCYRTTTINSEIHCPTAALTMINSIPLSGKKRKSHSEWDWLSPSQIPFCRPSLFERESNTLFFNKSFWNSIKRMPQAQVLVQMYPVNNLNRIVSDIFVKKYENLGHFEGLNVGKSASNIGAVDGSLRTLVVELSSMVWPWFVPISESKLHVDACYDAQKRVCQLSGCFLRPTIMEWIYAGDPHMEGTSQILCSRVNGMEDVVQQASQQDHSSQPQWTLSPRDLWKIKSIWLLFVT